MSAVPSVNSRSSTSIPENTKFQKIFSAIPVVGCFFSKPAHEALSNRINDLAVAGAEEGDDFYKKTYDMLDVRRDYHLADACRGVLTLAIVVATVAIFHLPFIIFFAAGVAGVIDFVATGRALIGMQQDAKEMEQMQNLLKEREAEGVSH